MKAPANKDSRSSGGICRGFKCRGSWRTGGENIWDPAPSQGRGWCGARQHSEPCDIPLSGAQAQDTTTTPTAVSALHFLCAGHSPQGTALVDQLRRCPPGEVGSSPVTPTPPFPMVSKNLCFDPAPRHCTEEPNFKIILFCLSPFTDRRGESLKEKTEGTFLFQPLWRVWKATLQQ